MVSETVKLMAPVLGQNASRVTLAVDFQEGVGPGGAQRLQRIHVRCKYAPQFVALCAAVQARQARAGLKLVEAWVPTSDFLQRQTE